MGKLNIQGTGKVTAIPDTASLFVSVTSTHTSTAEALKQNNAAVAQLLAGYDKLGLDRKDIKTTSFNVSPIYKRENKIATHEIESWRVVNSFAVIVRRLDSLGDVLTASAVHGQVAGPMFSCSNQEALEDEARSKATKNAIAKAQRYADAAGAKLTGLIELSEVSGGYGYGGGGRAYAMRACASTEAVQVEAGEQEVSVTVSAQFEIGGTLLAGRVEEVLESAPSKSRRR